MMTKGDFMKTIKAFLTLSLALISFASLGSLEGQWEGAGEYSNNKNDREKCAKMSWTVIKSEKKISLKYEFICQSFDFIDTVILEKKGNHLLQKGQGVGQFKEDKDTLTLTLNAVKFEIFQGNLHISAKLHKTSQILDYSDKFIYPDGLIDYFQSTMQQQ